MKLSQICIQRIKRDKAMLKTANLESQGIYIHFEDDIESPIKVMIIGPKDTPYECGFYMFEFKFGSEYPWKPPTGKFLTTDGISRMHPNLYAKDGKICLSLLGTWSGPSWTACQTILSVLLSLIPLFNEYPLQCEPSYEISQYNPPGQRHKDYNKFVFHENIRLAVIENLNSPPKGYECFLPIIHKKVIEFLPNYIKICNENMHIKTVTSCIYTCVKKTEYKNMITIFKEYANKYNVNISNLEIPNEEMLKLDSNTITDYDVDSFLKSKKKKRVPNEKACEYDEGYVKISQNDNRQYYVKSFYNKDTNAFMYKRWILKTN